MVVKAPEEVLLECTKAYTDKIRNALEKGMENMNQAIAEVKTEPEDGTGQHQFYLSPPEIREPVCVEADTNDFNAVFKSKDGNTYRITIRREYD